MLLIYTVFLLRKLQVQNWNVRKIRIVLYVKKAANVWETPLHYQSQIPNGTYEIWATNLEGRLLLKSRRLRLTRAWEN